jgi:transposase-like protein
VSRQRKPSRQVSVDEQIQVVLAVLKGELSLAEAARRHGCPRRRWATGGTGSSTLSLRRLTSPSNTAISVWPLADPLLDWEVLT